MGGSGERVGLWGRVGGVRVDVNEELNFFVKIKKKNWGGVGSGGGVWFGGQGGCERRVEGLGKIQKKNGGRRGVGGQGWVEGGSGWGVRVDVNEEFFWKIHKIKSGGREEGVRWGSGWWGVRVDVNEELKFL